MENPEGRIGIIGAGTMGVGLAVALAEKGIASVLVDNDQKRLAAATSGFRDASRAARLLRRSSILMRELEVTDRLEGLKDLTIVIDNSTENIDSKLRIMNLLSDILDERATVIINTSCIPIEALARSYRYPANVLGVHFMNPVPLRPMVELMRPATASEATMQKIKKFLGQIGKQYVVVSDKPGFVINRILMITINESIKSLDENRADPGEIDRLFKGCLGHQMGPLETADLIGLDTIKYSLEVLRDTLNDDVFEPAPLLEKLVEQGHLGRKTGKGIHNYANIS